MSGGVSAAARSAPPKRDPPSAVEAATWLSSRERGTLFGIRLFYWLATALGRTPTRLVVRLVGLWYVLFRPSVARASRAWLEAATGGRVSWSHVYRHVCCFAQVTVDRIFFLRGETAGLQITRTGDHHLHRARDAGRGAILIGAHLGSFEALRADADDIGVPINILGHFANAKMVNALFDQLNPGVAARVIHIEVDSVDFIFRVQASVAQGQFVGTMGDRVGLNERAVTADFFGCPARFPTGPFVLASVLKCPVFLTFGLFRSPNRYDLYCEPFSDQVRLPRRERAAALEALVRRYVARLEHYGRQAPYNWFNFYDFWRARADSTERRPPPTTPRGAD